MTGIHFLVVPCMNDEERRISLLRDGHGIEVIQHGAGNFLGPTNQRRSGAVIEPGRAGKGVKQPLDAARRAYDGQPRGREAADTVHDAARGQHQARAAEGVTNRTIERSKLPLRLKDHIHRQAHVQVAPAGLPMAWKIKDYHLIAISCQALRQCRDVGGGRAPAVHHKKSSPWRLASTIEAIGHHASPPDLKRHGLRAGKPFATFRMHLMRLAACRFA